MWLQQLNRRLFTILTLISGLRLSLQHGRLMEPPSRASMWRVGFPTPADQDDNQAYCGGFGVQHNKNGGKCGICGDPWHTFPRPHEAPGGIFANGIITKTYRQGSLIPVIVDITANHQGYFIFKLCPNNDIFHDPDQSCFDRFPLTTANGNSVQYPINDYVTGLRLLYVSLPLTVTCEQCILQWSYVGGNNWGTCTNGTSGLGCGPQETFRSCADIRITPHPLLSPPKETQAFAEESFVDLNEEDDLAIDFADIVNERDSMEDLERKEELLRKKKMILERVLEKLKELIFLSQEAKSEGNSFWNQNNALEDLRSEESEAKMFQPDPDPLRWNRVDRKDDYGQQDNWWEKIFSNRH